MEVYDQAFHSDEHSLAALFRVVLFVIEPYAGGMSSRTEVRELAKVMRRTIDALESVDDASKMSAPLRTTSAPRSRNQLIGADVTSPLSHRV